MGMGTMFGWHGNGNGNGIETCGNGKEWESWRLFPAHLYFNDVEWLWTTVTHHLTIHCLSELTVYL